MSYTQWLHQHCPETKDWPAVDTFALIQQAKATYPHKKLEILLTTLWIFCFTLLHGFIGQPLLEYSEQGYFWSGEAACVLLVGVMICAFLEQKIQQRLIRKKLVELVQEHPFAKKVL